MLHGHGHTHMDATRQHVCLICKPDTCHNSMIGVSLLCMHTLHACIFTCIHMYRGIRNCIITLRNPSGEVNVSHTMRDTNARGCARTDKYTHTHTETETWPLQEGIGSKSFVSKVNYRKKRLKIQFIKVDLHI